MSKPSPKIYKRIAISFIVIATVLISVILFLSLMSTHITIVPEKEVFTSQFDLEAKTDATQREYERDHIVNFETGTIEVSTSGTFKASGEAQNDQQIVASVTLVNNSAKRQPLIATTRVLSKDKQLFRIANDVDLLPNDRAVVDIYADDLEAVRGQEVSTQEMIIPGLWEGLHELIYAQVTDAFVIEPKEIHVITTDDINMAKTDLSNAFSEEVMRELGDSDTDHYVFILNVEVTKFQPSLELGTLTSTFEALATGEVRYARIPKDQFLASSYQILKTRLRPNQNILSIQEDQFTVRLKEVLDDTHFMLGVSYDGHTTLAPLDALVSKEELSGKSEKEIRAYFEEFPNIERIDISFTPPFLRRTPFLLDHINVTIDQNTAN